MTLATLGFLPLLAAGALALAGCSSGEAGHRQHASSASPGHHHAARGRGPRRARGHGGHGSARPQTSSRPNRPFGGRHGHAAGSPSHNPRAPSIPAAAKRTTVTGEVDGDTVDLAGLGSSRLIGIDTPEVYGGAECFGAQASAFTKRELPVGASVYYVHGVERTDRYNRDLVYLWLPGGTFFNALLAKEGYAVTLTIPPNDRFAGLFHHLAASARQAGRGLWSQATCDGNPNEPVGAADAGAAGRGNTGGGSSGGGPPPSGGDRDCADFRTHAQAQRYFEAKGGPAKDPDNLDSDGDGIACEDLP